MVLKNYRRTIILLLALLIFLLRLSVLKYCPNLYDEGYLNYGTMRYLGGQLPGIDFHAYAPGRYLLMAEVFRHFGSLLAVSRITLFILSGIFGMLLVGIIWRYYGMWWAIMPLACFALLPGPWHKIFFPISILGFGLLWNRLYILNNRVGDFLTGVLVALCFFVREEAGCIVLLWSLVMQIEPVRNILLGDNAFPVLSVRSTIATLKAWFVFTAGLMTGGILLIILVFPITNVPEIIRFYIIELLNPFKNSFFHPLLQELPNPIESLILALKSNRWLTSAIYSQLILCLLVIYAVLGLRRHLNPKILRWQIYGGYISIFAAWQAVIQPDAPHFLQSINLMYVPITGLFYNIRMIINTCNNKRQRLSKALLIAAWFSVFVLIIKAGTENRFSAYYTGSPMMAFHASEKTILPGNGEWWVEKYDLAAYEFIQGLKKKISPEATFVVIPSGSLFNFLLRITNPLSFDLLHPHILLNLKRRMQLMNELQSPGVDYLLLSENEFFFPENPVEERHFRHYGRPVYDLIRETYHFVDFIPGWWLFKKGSTSSTPLIFTVTEALTQKDWSTAYAGILSLRQMVLLGETPRWKAFLNYLENLILNQTTY